MVARGLGKLAALGSRGEVWPMTGRQGMMGELPYREGILSLLGIITSLLAILSIVTHINGVYRGILSWKFRLVRSIDDQAICAHHGEVKQVPPPQLNARTTKRNEYQMSQSRE